MKATAARSRKAPRTTAQILRDYQGPALFSFGFRPFFLLATLWAAVAVPIWLMSFMGVIGGEGQLFTAVWHRHEMLFGYGGAVIVGYLIVAGANWTGHFPVAGRPVVLLVLLWLAGRAAMLVAPLIGPAASVIDSAFLLVFALALWREQLAAANWRSLAPCVILSLLALADVGFHLEGAFPELGAMAERLAIGGIAFLIALMGGRLVPSFTRNWMAQRRIQPEPPAYDRLDMLALVVTGAGVAGWVLAPERAATGVLLVASGLALLVRLWRWRGWVAVSEAMVFVLHCGYFWCAIGFVLLGVSVLAPGLVPRSGAVHALTVGAIGVMTLAVMTRTSRSHTGRERTADAPTTALYGLINLAAVLRVAASLVSAGYALLLTASAISWTVAFALFLLAYGPMLCRRWQRQVKSSQREKPQGQGR